MDSTLPSAPMAELLVLLRLHLLAMAGHLPASAQADYQACTRLIDHALLQARATTAQAVVVAGLTPRENQILQLLQRGHSNQQIGVRMGITTGTVKTYLKSIYGKLGVCNRTQAALFVPHF